MFYGGNYGILKAWCFMSWKSSELQCNNQRLLI